MKSSGVLAWVTHSYTVSIKEADNKTKPEKASELLQCERT